MEIFWQRAHTKRLINLIKPSIKAHYRPGPYAMRVNGCISVVITFIFNATVKASLKLESEVL